MPFNRPTLNEIIERIDGDIVTRIEGANTLLRRSVLKVLSRAYGGAVYTLYGYLNFIKDQLFASSADAEYLETIGSEFGISRKAATYAKGEATATGTAGYLLPAGTRLQYSGGQVYTIDADVIIGITGTADISLTAEIAGVEGNQDPLAILSFVSPIVGIDSTVTVDINGLIGGVDQESDDDLRDRILTRKRQPPHGGAEFDYNTWAMEVAGVTRVWTFPYYQGIGTIGVAFVRDNDSNTIIPNAAQMDEVYDYIIYHLDALTTLPVGIPVTAKYGLFIVPVSLQSVDMTILLNPNTADVQLNVLAAINNLLLDKVGPGETLYLSDIIKYVVSASGVVAAKIIVPSADVGFAVNKVPVRGTITFGAY